MEYNIKEQIKEDDAKKRWSELLKDLGKSKFIQKKGKEYLWIDSNKYFARFCSFVKENMFYYSGHTIYPYFTPIFKKKDGSDFTNKQLGKNLVDYDCSPPSARGDKFEEILLKYKR